MSICYKIIRWKYLKTNLILSISQIKLAYKFENSPLS